MSILIKKATLPDGSQKDILIRGNRIADVQPNLQVSADEIIDASHFAAIPSFVNAHTHAAMTLMRGYSDDLPVQEWLEQKIWPLESSLTEEDVYWGAKLACLEMIKTGTTLFNDMYWHYHATARAVEEMGIRATISAVLIDAFDKGKSNEQIALNQRLYRETRQYSDRIRFALGPHAIYTVSPKSLRWTKQFADDHDCIIHIHLSESQGEIADCISQHGKRPVHYLKDVGFLGPNVVAVHGIWLDEEELTILADHDCKIVHNPASNMKLGSGRFAYHKMRGAGLTVGLGTDGCASNNNLDMLEEMKIASIHQKISEMDPVAMPAEEVFAMATGNGAEILGVDIGAIAPGKLADLLLVDLHHFSMVPNHHLISNLVFSAISSAIDTTICNGKILMRQGHIEGEEETITKFMEVAHALVSKVS